MLPALFAFLHHAAAFMLVASLAIERAALSGSFTLDAARQLVRADRAYGIAAGMILVIGGLRVAFFEKTPAYYSHNIPFLLKIALFLAVGVLSIWPTLKFLSWRGALAQGELPHVKPETLARLNLIVRIEFALVLAIILCAALMAKGVGTF